uniref:Late embryogenesis abundant n=1 Tax=Cleistogenes songorica TaxID=121774 RepID=A0A2S1WLS5_9POAL|nr:late embryogenesis abundant [Cleistogenes songorica]
MQAGRNAMEATKEAAANLGASATAGMHKTRAAVQGAADKATAHDASEQAAAEANQQDRVSAAEAEKQDAMRANAAARERATGAATYLHPSQGAPGIDAGAAPAGGHVESGVGQTRPVARATGTGRPSAAHNPYVGSDFAQGRGTGGQYQ